MKIENGLLVFVREETGSKTKKINTVLDNYHGTPRLSILHVWSLISKIKI